MAPFIDDIVNRQMAELHVPAKRPEPMEAEAEVEPMEAEADVEPVDPMEAEPMEVEAEVEPMEAEAEVEPMDVEAEVKPVEAEPMDVEAEVEPMEAEAEVEPEVEPIEEEAIEKEKHSQTVSVKRTLFSSVAETVKRTKRVGSNLPLVKAGPLLKGLPMDKNRETYCGEEMFLFDHEFPSTHYPNAYK